MDTDNLQALNDVNGDMVVHDDVHDGIHDDAHGVAHGHMEDHNDDENGHDDVFDPKVYEENANRNYQPLTLTIQILKHQPFCHFLI